MTSVLTFSSSRKQPIHEIYQSIKGSLSIAQQRSLARLLAFDFPDDAHLGVEDYQNEERPFSPRDLVEAVAGAFGMTYAELTGPSRTMRYTRPRQIAAAILRSSWFNLSLEETAATLNRKDHTTILYYLEKHVQDDVFWNTVASIASRAGISNETAISRLSGGR